MLDIPTKKYEIKCVKTRNLWKSARLRIRMWRSFLCTMSKVWKRTNKKRTHTHTSQILVCMHVARYIAAVGETLEIHTCSDGSTSSCTCECSRFLFFLLSPLFATQSSLLWHSAVRTLIVATLTGFFRLEMVLRKKNILNHLFMSMQ